jgi:hypothetical protein
MSNIDEYRERKLERLRLGQSACELTELVSDPEIRVAVVPLTEGEYSNSLYEAEKLGVSNTPAGAALVDEIQRKWVIFHAVRVVGNLNVKFFNAFADVDDLEASDINHLYDIYLELVADSSPSLMGLGEDDFNSLKVLLPRMAWSELSGPQWYAAQRFLNSIQLDLLQASSSGSPSTES